ncbi:hypothetical protein BC628DRAFT_1417731 [Trametes gibbosa]|nr:hypothetical protein BC628DRAFT_1417731 [Trametes gibbosa]
MEVIATHAEVDVSTGIMTVQHGLEAYGGGKCTGGYRTSKGSDRKRAQNFLGDAYFDYKATGGLEEGGHGTRLNMSAKPQLPGAVQQKYTEGIDSICTSWDGRELNLLGYRVAVAGELARIHGDEVIEYHGEHREHAQRVREVIKSVMTDHGSSELYERKRK